METTLYAQAKSSLCSRPTKAGGPVPFLVVAIALTVVGLAAAR